MMVNDVRHTYTVEVDDTEVNFEALYSYPKRRRRRIFEREGLEISFQRGLAGQAGTKELLTPTTLALSVARRYEDTVIRPFAVTLGAIAVLGLRRGPVTNPNYWPTGRLFADPDTTTQRPLPDAGLHSVRETALKLLQFADLGIEDVEFVEEPAPTTSAAAPEQGRMQLRLVHKAGEQRRSFGLSEESDGTRTWFYLIGPTLYALSTGKILLFDEIDSSLHPRLSARLIEMFQDPETNPHGAQLIFTSHDTSLLNHLNRDEVWLTEKGRDGATVLTALAEYGGDKVRRSLNLERAYLQGRFGAVPELDQYAVRRVLGLVREDA